METSTVHRGGPAAFPHIPVSEGSLELGSKKLTWCGSLSNSTQTSPVFRLLVPEKPAARQSRQQLGYHSPRRPLPSDLDGPWDDSQIGLQGDRIVRKPNRDTLIRLPLSLYLTHPSTRMLPRLWEPEPRSLSCAPRWLARIPASPCDEKHLHDLVRAFPQPEKPFFTLAR